MANLRPGSPSLDLTGCDVSNHERIPSDTSVKQITWQSDDFEDSDATTRDQGSQPGDLDPTEEVSRILQDLDAVPEPEKIGRLRSLTSECLYRFKPEGDLLGIDAAISVLEKAILTISHDHNLKPILLNQLGDVYRCRFENQEESKDIDMAINSKKQAVSLVHDNILLSRDWLNELAMFYLDRFHSEQDFSDINMAIEHMSRAASPVNKDPSGKTKRLNNLANLHHVRFQHLGDLADIYTAIELLHLVAKHASDADSDTVGPLDSEVDGKLEIAVSSLTGVSHNTYKQSQKR
ncbi:hypothetical protein FS749_016481, partial [Ceratobasidium sp. UAMH 11750]